MLSAVFLIVALLISTVSYQRPVSISSSNILQELAERKKKQPAVTSRELAVIGNELLEKRGFDYMFDVCDILPKHSRTSTTAISASHTLSLTNGAKRSFRFTVAGDGEGLCGECMSLVPAVQVTAREMVLISEGKRYRVRRPASFILDEAELVDASMKKVLRTWQLPYQTFPLGISPDGAKLYLEFRQDELDGLVLELSENGALAFRDRTEVKLVEGKPIEDHPKDPNNAYLSFKRFDTGNKTYLIRFSAPCT
jgi:hypothetical protein